MLTQQMIKETLKRYRPLLQKQYKVTKIGLFGSFIRNEATEESDIDILVDFEPVLGLEFFEMQNFLEEKLGRKIDLVSFRSLKAGWKEKILKEVSYIDEEKVV